MAARAIDPIRARLISPTVQILYDRHWGLCITCADCGHIMCYRTVGLVDQFKRYRNLTLLQLEFARVGVISVIRVEECRGKGALVLPTLNLDIPPLRCALPRS